MNTSHTVHPDSHKHGLSDGCDRCAEHARNPLRTLDNDNVRALLERVVNKEKSRSLNEERAMDHIQAAMDAAGQIAVVDAFLLAKYIHEKWGVQMVEVPFETT